MSHKDRLRTKNHPQFPPFDTLDRLLAFSGAEDRCGLSIREEVERRCTTRMGARDWDDLARCVLWEQTSQGPTIYEESPTAPFLA
ncbi:hypothetical protein OCU04_013061 [Sclerotinia nivalis]|uniref:Uncharacterized protein n=1 Tax=Sclerotinia nivalis TaxID=352851 RepID=A0A9X0A926_9HELO|nr:hypothetical protein OCU04_013061 [Sclerotinia nivalis]